MKQGILTDILSGMVLTALAFVSTYMIYRNQLYTNTFEIVISTVFELSVFILVAFGFWVIIKDSEMRKHVVTVEQIIDIPVEITESTENS